MSVMYIYDEHLKVVDISDTNAMETAKIDMSINEGSTLDITSTSKFPNQMRYVALRDPIAKRRSTDEEEFLMYRISSSAIEEDGLFSYTFTEFAYDELAYDGYIIEERPNQSTFNDGLDLILKGTKWKRGLTNIEGKEDLDFFYLTPIEAISELNKKFPAEFRFWLRLNDDGTIKERIVDAVKRRGQNTGKRFETTSNLISLVAEDDFTNVYSAIVPRGKGEEIDADGDPNTRPGYGRKISIKDVEWSKAKGDPLNKPKGQEWLALENGETLVDGRLRYKIVEFDDDTDPNVLIKHAYNQLLKDSVVKRQFTANALDLGVSELGDTVQLVDKERHMEYQARIFRVVYDMVEPTNSEVEFGDDIRSESSISNVISKITVKQEQIANDTNWAIQRADGKNTTYFGEDEPENPRRGDVWYKQLPNGNTEEYYYDGTAWVLGASTDQQWKENRAIAQGTQTTFYGPDTPVGAVKGDVWFKNDNNEPDGNAMYTYSGTEWLKFNGAHDANRLTAGEINGKLLQITNVDTSELIGEIDSKLNKLKNLDTNELIGGIDGNKNPLTNVPASQLTGTMNKEVVNTIELNAKQITSGELNSAIVNAIELNAAQITSGKLNSNIVNAIELNARQIVAGQIDASKINVFNLNADNIKTGTIDASKINVMNLSASSIVTGNLSANFLKGGQIDASQINVINMNASNLITGTLDAVKVKIVGKDANINMANGGVAFNPTTGDAWTTTVNRYGMDIKIKDQSRTTMGNNTITMYDNAAGYYRLGGLRTLKSNGSGENVHTAGVYLSLDEWQTTKNGDQYWNYGGPDFFGGSEIGFTHSTGVDNNGNILYSALMKWSNSLAAGRQAGVSKGFNFFDDINFQGHQFLVNGAANKMKFTWVSWSDWGNYHNIALTNESSTAGIAVNNDNLVLFGVNKRADAMTGWKA